MSDRICKIEGCQRSVRSFGFCKMHYERKYTGVVDMSPNYLRKKWTDDEIEFVKKNINKMKNSEMGKIINKSPSTIAAFCRRNNIKRDPIVSKRFMLSGTGPMGNMCDRNYTNYYFKKGELHPHWKGGLKKNHEHQKALNRKHMKTYRKKHPIKDKSRDMAKSALLSGSIKKQPCEICGCINSQMHHEDYTKPFDVKWFCRKHHIKRHNDIRRQKLCQRNASSASAKDPVNRQLALPNNIDTACQ